MYRSRMQGLTLVELMVSMLLGLVVIGGAVSLTLANRQSFRTNEGLSQMQESARTAFELLARDIRQAGLTGCDNQNRVANVLNQGTWWAAWAGIKGFDGTETTSTSAAAYGSARGDRVAGTDAFQVHGMQGTGLSIEFHDAPNANMKLNAATTDIVNGDVLMACDFDHATIFQVTNYQSTNVTLVHNNGTGTPGNCSKGHGYPTDCTTANGNTYGFGPNSQLVRLSAIDWYIGQSGRTTDSSRSLFRRRLAAAGNVVAEEIVSGVTDMQVTYRIGDADAFVDASGAITVAQWSEVTAVRVELIVESADTRVSTDPTDNSGRLDNSAHPFSQIIALRNRVP